MTKQLTTLTPDIWLDIFMYLFDGLNEDWQFDCMHNCLLVCREWNGYLNYRACGEQNFWRVLIHKYGVGTINSSEEEEKKNNGAAAEEELDLRRVLCQGIIPNSNEELIKIGDGVEIDGMFGANYQSYGHIDCFKIKSSMGLGLLKRMIKSDGDNIGKLFNQFITRITPEDVQFTTLDFKADFVKKYDYSEECARHSFYPSLYGGQTFEEVQKASNESFFKILTTAIRGKQVEIEDMKHLKKFLEEECPIMAEYENVYIGIIVSIAFVFFTRNGTCVVFQFSADD